MSKGKHSKIRNIATATMLATATLCSINATQIHNTVGIQEVQAADTNITILVNGTKVLFEDAEPYVENGRTMIPVRGVFEAMGFSVDWDNYAWSESNENIMYLYGTTNPELISIKTGTNVVQGGNISILKDNTIMQAGSKVETDADPVLIDGRYYLPIRVIAENTGATVGWEQDTKTVTIDFTPTPVTQNQAEVEANLGEGYVGRWGDPDTVNDSKAAQYGTFESINMDNYNHKAYFKNAPEGNGVVPTGAYYIQTDNALAGSLVHSIALGGVKLSNGESVYIGESQASVEGKFGKPDRIDTNGASVYNENGGFRVYYTSSGRVKKLVVETGEYNGNKNIGFSYGSGSMYLGQEKGTETFGAGESMSNGSVRYCGLMFGIDRSIDYYWLESGGKWSSVVIEIMPLNDPDKDHTQDPF